MTTPNATPSGTPKGLRKTLALTYELIAGHRRALAVVVVCAVLSGFAEALVLVVVARLAFALASQSSDVTLTPGPVGKVTISYEMLVAIAAALIVVRVGMQLIGARISSRLGASVANEYRTRIVRAYLNATWAMQSGERTGRLQEMIGTFVREASNAVTTFASALVALVTLFAFLITAVAVNVVAAVAVAVAAVGLAMLLRPLRTAVRGAARRLARANLDVATGVTETAAHQLETRIFGTEEVVEKRLSDTFERVGALEQRRNYLNMLAPIMYQGTALMLLVGTVGLLFAAGVSGLGAVGGVVLIMLRSLSYGQTLQSTYQSLHSAAPSMERVRDELARYEGAAVDRSGTSIDGIGALQFEGVTFEYEPGRAVLRDLSFDVAHGEIVGIVGPSGAGKSTLVQLILRLRQPSSGRILVDGVDIRKVGLDDWYEHVSFVPQDSSLFAGSVSDNITFYRTTVDEHAVERAAKLANLHDEIVSWPLGYASKVGERGGQLSGGQRQRLCIARALAESPDVVIFDESTSALDVKSEAAIRRTIESLAPNATVFVIAHRLSTLAICDRIMVLVDGELLAFDEPNRLEKTSPFYREALELSGLR